MKISQGQILGLQDDLLEIESDIIDLNNLLGNSGLFFGNKTFVGNVIVSGDMYASGKIFLSGSGLKSMVFRDAQEFLLKSEYIDGTGIVFKSSLTSSVSGANSGPLFGDLTVSGNISGQSLYGNGAGITGIPYSNLISLPNTGTMAYENSGEYLSIVSYVNGTGEVYKSTLVNSVNGASGGTLTSNLSVNGSISGQTLYGNGEGITGIIYSNLISQPNTGTMAYENSGEYLSVAFYVNGTGEVYKSTLVDSINGASGGTLTSNLTVNGIVSGQNLYGNAANLTGLPYTSLQQAPIIGYQPIPSGQVILYVTGSQFSGTVAANTSVCGPASLPQKVNTYPYNFTNTGFNVELSEFISGAGYNLAYQAFYA